MEPILIGTLVITTIVLLLYYGIKEITFEGWVHKGLVVLIAANVLLAGIRMWFYQS